MLEEFLPGGGMDLGKIAAGDEDEVRPPAVQDFKDILFHGGVEAADDGGAGIALCAGPGVGFHDLLRSAAGRHQEGMRAVGEQGKVSVEMESGMGGGTFGEVTAGAGRNSLALAGTLGTVTTGDGDNAVAVSGIGTIVTTGAGRDSIEGAQWVNAGQGDDSITLGNADLSSIAWRSGEGSDTITLAPAAAGTRATASRAIIGDGSGAHEAQAIGIAPQDQLRLALPQAGEAGAGTAHAAVYLQGVGESDVTASLSGTDLTLSMATTGETLTIHNYSPGRVTFLFDYQNAGGGMGATRTLAGMA